MRDLGRARGEIEELDGRGLCAIPGLVDCHTHPAWGGDRVEEFSLRAAGATYEELHAAGGGILSTVAATRGARARTALAARVARHAAWFLGHGTTTWEGKSGYGLDRDTELASLRAVRARGRCSRPGSAPTRCRPSSPTPTRTSTSRSPRCCRRPRGRSGGRRLPRARCVRRDAGAELPDACREAASRCGCTATSSRRAARSRSRSSSAPDRSTTSRRPAPRRRALARERRRRRAAPGERALPRTARCRRPVRSPTRAPPWRSPPTSTRAAPSRPACRSSARSAARSCISPRPRR